MRHDQSTMRHGLSDSSSRWARRITAILALSVGTPAVMAHMLEPDDTAYRLGIGLLHKGMHDLAAVELRRSLDANPNGPFATEARYSLAICLSNLDKPTEACEELDRILATKGFEFAADAMLLRGGLALRSTDAKEWERAASLMDKLANEHPDFNRLDEAAMIRGEALARSGQHQACVAALEGFAKRWPASPWLARVDFQVASAQAALGDFEAAAKRAEGLLSRDGSETLAPHAALLAARSRHRLNDLQAADKLYTQAVASGVPELLPDALLGTAQVARALGELPKAEQALNRLAGSPVPDAIKPIVALEYGRVLFDKKAFDDAIQILDPLTRSRDAAIAGRAAYWAARSEDASDRPERAIERYGQAAELLGKDPLAADAALDRATLLARTGKSDEAAKAIDQWNATYKGTSLSAEAIALQASVLHERKSYDKSADLCRQFLEQTDDDHPRAESIRLILAENERAQGHQEEAQSAFADFLERYPKSAHAWRAGVQRGLCLAALDQDDQAVQVLEPLMQAAGEQPATLRRMAASVLGDHALTKQDWSGAAKWFHQVTTLSSDPSEQLEARLRLGIAQARLGRAEEAATTLAAVASVRDAGLPAVRANCELGQMLADAGRLEEARQAFETAVKAEPSEQTVPLIVLASRHLASIASKQGRHEDAAALLAKVASYPGESDEQAAENQLLQARALISAGNHEQAERVLSGWIDRFEDQSSVTSARAWHGVTLARLGKPQLALGEFDAALKDESLDKPTEHMVRFERARALIDTKQPDEAAQEFNRLLEASPAPDLGAHACIELARLLAGKNKDAEALKVLERCRGELDQAGSSSKAGMQAIAVHERYLRGICLLRTGSPGAAVEALESAPAGEIPADLQGPMSQALGEALLASGRADDAAKSFERSIGLLKNDPSSASALLRLGEARAASQRWAASDEAFTTFLERFPEHELWFQAKFGQAWAREQQGRHDAAITDYGVVVAKHEGPTAARAQFQIGECLYAQKKFEEAIREFLKVDVLYAYPEWSAAAIYEAGRCFVESRRVSDGIKQFEDVIQRFPESSWAGLARQRLEEVKPASLPGRGDARR